MAANKFATMLHRNTNKITLILVYAMLEWILIILLLLNSLFSYLIIKFADYFGLKRPCVWCSRLDHILEPAKNKSCYRDLVCEAHATEISKLVYCLNHRKLAESQDMCEDCSSSSHPDCPELSKDFAFFPWMKQIGFFQDGGNKVMENDEVNSKCSCCGVMLERKLCSPPYLLIKPSWELLDYTQKVNPIPETGIDDIVDEGDHSDPSRSDFLADHFEDEQGTEEDGGQMLSDADGNVDRRELEEDEEFSCFVSSFDCKQDAKSDFVMKKDEESVQAEALTVSLDGASCQAEELTEVCSGNVASPAILPKHLEFYIDQDDCHLIPVDLMDSTSSEKKNRYKFREEDQGVSGSGDVILDFDLLGGPPLELFPDNMCGLVEKMAPLSALESEEDIIAAVESVDSKEKASNSVQAGEEDLMVKVEECEKVAITQATQTPSIEAYDIEQSAAPGEEIDSSEVNQVSDEQNDEIEAEISIGTEIPDQEPIDEIQTQEVLPSCLCTQEEYPSTSSTQVHADEDHVGSKNAEEEFLHFNAIAFELCDQSISLSSELNEMEEDKFPDTPTSVDSLHQLHKKLLLLERKESGTEESLDGSVMSDIEGGDGVLTVEKLKSALKAERKALNALYAELEEERSASAVAANQTMAMINRLQEEKAAMQMEALQYQRMMEEQSEYDQEALQLLNELMVKREKEKAELEKELEIYRKRLQDYEAKEKIMMLRRRKDSSTRSATSSASCSNAEDSDGLSVDLNHEPKEVHTFDNHQEDSNQNTPADAVLYLEESLANFEEERLSILDQLKVLEEKLVLLNDEEEQHFVDIKPFEHLHEENGNAYHENSDFSREENGVANVHFKGINGKYHPERKKLGSKAKRLLPLFNATDAEAEDGVINGHENGNDLEAEDGALNGHENGTDTEGEDGELNGHENGFDSVDFEHSKASNVELVNKKCAIEEEVDHVYDRLQALEADREFLKHCINSLRKGDKGIYLLQEILQHLRDLRSVELRVRNMGDVAI